MISTTFLDTARRPEHFVVKRGEITRIQFTADTPGTFKIHCQVHEPGMVGYLVVLPR